MNTDERDLIAGLFDRMRPMQGIQKDQAAAELIAREGAANPDAMYLLTQSVLVQEHALQQADARIRDLEAKLSAAQTAGRADGANRSSSFLGGLAPSAGRSGGAQSSVPSVGNSGMTAPRKSSGFGGSSAAAPESRPAANQNARGTGGGFMAQAMTTAAGVAGGMLLASGISSLFASSTATASPAASEPAATDPAGVTPVSDTTATPEGNANDPSVDNAVDHAQPDAADEGSFWDAGGSDDWGDFGGDLDI